MVDFISNWGNGKPITALRRTTTMPKTAYSVLNSSKKWEGHHDSARFCDCFSFFQKCLGGLISQARSPDPKSPRFSMFHGDQVLAYNHASHGWCAP